MALTKISTDGVKDDAITKAKIPADQIEASELANNAVDTNAIADQAVTLDKLPHGDSNNNGKFLRANNGADPSFEDVPAGGISDVVSDTTPQLGGNLDTNGNDIDFADNVKATFGASEDLLIKHSGTNSEIYHNGEGHFYIAAQGSSEMLLLSAAADIRLSNSVSGDMYLKAISDGAVELYHDNTKQCETSANGLAFPSGKGIDFSASSNETGKTGEILDDYERGNFTPAWTFSPNEASGIAYTSQDGNYVKVGRMVFFTIHLMLSNKGTVNGSGWAQIDHLPFAVAGEGGFGSITYYDNMGSFNPALGRVTQNEQIYIAQHNSGGYSQDFQHSFMNNGTRIYIAGCYMTNA